MGLFVIAKQTLRPICLKVKGSWMVENHKTDLDGQDQVRYGQSDLVFGRVKSVLENINKTWSYRLSHQLPTNDWSIRSSIICLLRCGPLWRLTLYSSSRALRRASRTVLFTLFDSLIFDCGWHCRELAVTFVCFCVWRWVLMFMLYNYTSFKMALRNLINILIADKIK